jgi:HSP20 family protein
MMPSGGRETGMMRARSPFELMSHLSQQMDRLFEDFWGSPFPSSAPARWHDWERSESLASWMPAVEVHQHDGEIVVRADLPGMKKDDVKVEIEDQTLVIQGERRQGCEEDREGHYRSECRYGSFYRAIALPKDVDPDDVRAEFEHGVLEVRVPTPRREESRKSIEVQGRNR